MDPLFDRRADRPARRTHLGHGRRGHFGPVPPGFGPRRRHGTGRRRGDLRGVILGLLAERPMHGYEMIQEVEARTGGAWRPSPGSIYPMLQMLEDEGLISSEESGGRRRFSLTESGREAAEQAGPSVLDRIAEHVDPAFAQLRAAVVQIHQAAEQVAQAGSEEQKARAVEVLGDTRRRLYSILAE